jgi:alkylation response protein AidB-like acyl-CoA dehydrogenase
MDYLLTEEQQMLRDLARQITAERIKPMRAELDEQETFPWDIIKDLAQADLCGTIIPEAYGGLGMGCLENVLVLEALAEGCVGVATTYAASFLGAYPLLLYGSEEQKQKYLPPLARGEALAAFALTEAQAGSDAGAILATAAKDGDHYVLNGTKQWITNAGEAEINTIIALTDKSKGARGASAFLVEKGDQGVSFGKKEKKMGIRASVTREIVMEDVRIPKDRLLGREGLGFIITMRTLDLARSGAGALAVGLAQSALDEAASLCQGAPAVRPAHHRLPGRAAHAGGHGHQNRGRPGPGVRRGPLHRQRRQGFHQTRGHGQALPHRHGHGGHHRRGAGHGGPRLYAGIPRGKDDAGRQDPPDLRRHQPDHAQHHRPGAE